jgi:hypothetical protein
VDIGIEEGAGDVLLLDVGGPGTGLRATEQSRGCEYLMQGRSSPTVSNHVAVHLRRPAHQPIRGRGHP